jgi:hypothetical protein
MQNFWVYRVKDESHISGTGCVLEGVVFHNGDVYVCWRSKTPSVGVFESFEEFKSVHIDTHPSNGTRIVWGEKLEPPDIEKSVLV